MDAVVVYFSRTGNTQQLAQTIAEEMNAPLMSIDSILPSTIETFDTLVLGTPVNGSGPAKEVRAFIEGMNKVEGKKAILFCTYRLFGNQRTLKAMEKALSAKGYKTINKISKKVKPKKEPDLSEVLLDAKKAIRDM